MVYEIAESLINANVGGSDYQDSDEHVKNFLYEVTLFWRSDALAKLTLVSVKVDKLYVNPKSAWKWRSDLFESQIESFQIAVLGIRKFLFPVNLISNLRFQVISVVKGVIRTKYSLQAKIHHKSSPTRRKWFEDNHSWFWQKIVFSRTIFNILRLK